MRSTSATASKLLHLSIGEVGAALVLLCLMVWAAGFSLYGSGVLGGQLLQLPLMIDVWFDADITRVYNDMAVFDSGHGFLYKHPLFTLASWPLTAVFATLTGDWLIAVRLVVATNAAVVVLLLWTLLVRVGLRTLDVALCCVLFLTSSAFVFWFTVPETFAFGATTLLVALHAATWKRPTTPAGILLHAAANASTLAMTLTNWFAGLVATATATGLLDHPLATARNWVADLRTFWRDIKTPLLISSVAFAMALAAAVFQDRIFGEVGLFINVFAVARESQFVAEYDVTSPYVRPFVLWFGSLVVGAISTWHDGTRLTADHILPEGLAGLAAFALWASLLVLGLHAIVLKLTRPTEGERRVRRLAIAAIAVLVGFSLLHTVYGFVTFLYVAHTVPLLIAIAAVSLLGPARNLARVVLVLLIVAAAYHNVPAFHQSAEFVAALTEKG